jgi:hypothetical protein
MFTVGVKVALCSYAILSLPYVGLALDSLSKPQGHAFSSRRQTVSRDPLQEISVRDVYANTGDISERSAVPFHVSSQTVKYTIPKDEQEEFYFRNFTLVGKKSEGFNITQFDMDTGRLDKRDGASSLVDGDAVLKYVGAGILAGAALTVACIIVSSACGAYIGTNIRAFTAALSNLPIEQAGQAAVELTETAVGGTPAGLLGNGRTGNKTELEKRDYTLFEAFGCYYENSNPEVCSDPNVSGPFLQQVVDNDGAGEDTPVWSCYELSDASDGKIYGYYAHCFNDNEDCDVTCGSAGPDNYAPINLIDDPPS